MAEFALPRTPEDLQRLTAPADPGYCLIALLRLLSGLRPSYQEQEWAVQSAIAARPGSWFALRRHGVATGYLQAEPSRGRYASTPPEGVDPATLIVLDMPDPPPTTMRDFFASMRAALAPAAGGSFDMAAAMLAADEEQAGYLETRQFASALAAGAGLGLTESAVMEEYAASLRERFRAFALRGEVVGIMGLLAEVACQAGDAPVLVAALKRPPVNPIGSLAQFGEYVLAGVRAQPNGDDWIGSAAAALAEATETQLDAAAEATSLGGFYGAIHASVPLAYGAKRGFHFLGRAIEANQADERVATGMAALKVDFGNSMDWRFLLSHRAMVAGREDVAMELIDLATMYPPFFRPFLLGQTQTLPLVV